MVAGSIQQTLLIAVLGMGVVFLFLWILSLMMALITRVADRPERRESAASVAAQTGDRTLAAAASAEAPTTPPWVVLAAAAFLSAEELDATRSAAAWTPAVDPAWPNRPGPISNR